MRVRVPPERLRQTAVRCAVLATAAGLVLTLAGCSDSEQGGPSSTHGSPTAFGHIHGLGVNPADKRLYVASHLGVFRRTEDGFERVADRYQDTMAFTVTGDDTFLASGHPDLRETNQPIHLGLIESTDAASTWKTLSLAGEADFHALEPAGDRVYGYDSNNGVLKVTRDRRRWTDIARLGLVDLAVNPDQQEDLLITSTNAHLLRLDRQSKVSPLPDAPRLVYIDWPHSRLLVGVAPDGAVYRSRDQAKTWEQISTVNGPPQALDVLPGRWHLANDQGVFESTDDGRTWTRVTGHQEEAN